jgi:hypothetical protein
VNQRKEDRILHHQGLLILHEVVVVAVAEAEAEEERVVAEVEAEAEVVLLRILQRHQ